MNTISTIKSKFVKAEAITMLTAYDALFAKIIDAAGIDIILVGDSLGMVVRGEANTLQVSMNDMAYHTKMVSRGVSQALLVADMPFLSYQISPEEALNNAGRLVQEGGAQAIKLEGGTPFIPAINKIITAGIPVMGHLGFTPQSVNQIGGYKIQGKEADSSKQLVAEAKALEACGVFAIVVEMVPALVAKEIQDQLTIPIIGCGAGSHCAGQVVVTHDMLGLYPNPPRFVKKYADLGNEIAKAVAKYIEDVKEGQFPSEANSY